jgi:hypothetical protein
MNRADGPGRIEERARRLPAELPPARDLWPGIEARILDAAGQSAPSPAPARRAWLSLAAAATLVFAAAVAGFLHFAREPEQTTPGQVASQAPPPPAPFGPDHNLGSRYQAARAGLTDDFDQRLRALPPETRASVLQNLETIRQAMAEINAALGEDPANQFLQQQLLAAYQDELTVLANLQRVTERLSTRNEI